MKAIVGMLGALAALSACSQAPHGAANGCAARAEALWEARGEPLSLAAMADGPDCLRASALITLRNADGGVLWTGAYPAEQVASLIGHGDSRAMQQALASWIDPEQSPYRTSADLPEWPAAAEAPISGEFPFYPESWVDQRTYEDLRTRAVPLFCFVQGFESQACLAFDDGRVDLIGAQTFPG